MNDNVSLPSVLLQNLGSEKQDFAVKAKYSALHKKSIFFLFFGVAWLFIVSLIAYGMVSPLFRGEDVHLTVNNSPVVANINNLEPLYMVLVFIGIFILVGLFLLGYGIYSFTKKGGYFVGTPNRLVYYESNNMHSIDWEEFTGNISVKGNEQRGSISLEMRTGHIENSNNNSGVSRYVPDRIFMIGIENPYEIEALCRKRIKERIVNGF